MNLAFIGYGNMAKAIINGLKLGKSDRLTIASPSQQPALEGQCRFHPDNREAIQGADVIVLSVKPGKMTDVLRDIGSACPPQSVVISVAAGITVDWIKSFLPPDQAIVRCMPNTPIAVGQGATPLYANHPLSPHQKKNVEALFKHSSLITWLDNESTLNAFTALSGSGPAYVFLFMEALIEGGRQLGLTDEDARAFTIQTICGAVSLLKASGLSPAALRQQVTSSGGTTDAALTVLNQGQFTELVMEAMKKACDRAEELGSMKN